MRINNLFKTIVSSVLTMALVIGLIPTVFEKNAYASENGVSKAYEEVFEGDNIIDVNITIQDDDWESILESPLEKEYKSVTVDIDGTTLENVGFSTKGNLTLRSVAAMEDSDRYSFRLKFDKYDKEQTWLGLDKLSLNNNYSDPSYIREYLHYEALKYIGLDSPETVFVNLYINGELYGFYTGVEAIDDSFLERTMGSDYKDGVLYDTDMGATLKYEENGEYEKISYDMGTEDNKESLKNFIKVLNEMPDGEKGDIESVLDVDSALKYVAANAVLGNYDSYNGSNAQNYMLYANADGKYTVLPWDFNMSFNGFSGGGRRGGENSDSSQTNTDAVTASVDIPVLGISMEDAPLINNLLKVSEYKERYMEYVNELVDYLENIETRITELSDLIRPYVEADPTKFYTMEEFEANITYSSTENTNAEGMTPPQGTEFDKTKMPFENSDGTDVADADETMERPENTDFEGSPSFENEDGLTDQRGPKDHGENGEGKGPMGFGGNGGKAMASGSIMTFALNRLVNLQEQLGREVYSISRTTQTTENKADSLDEKDVDDISVVINGVKTELGLDKAFMESDEAIVPIYAVCEALGAEYEWNEELKTIDVLYNDKNVVFTVGKSKAEVNKEEGQMAVPVKVINSRAFVSAKFLAQSLGLTYEISDDNKELTITSK